MIEEPLIEIVPMTDLYVDGVHQIEIIGENVRVVYFVRRWIDGQIGRVAAERAIVRPRSSMPRAPSLWSVVPRILSPTEVLEIH